MQRAAIASDCKKATTLVGIRAASVVLAAMEVRSTWPESVRRHRRQRARIRVRRLHAMIFAPQRPTSDDVTALGAIAPEDVRRLVGRDGRRS